MYIGLPQANTDSINRSLEAQHQDANDDIKSIFNVAREFARSSIIDRQLPDFNHKRALGNAQRSTLALHARRSLAGVSREGDFTSTTKQHHFIEETLRSKFDSYYKSNTDDWNSMKNSKEYVRLHFEPETDHHDCISSLALVCALATYFKRCDIKKCGNIPLEKIPKFLDREQRRLLSKLPRPTQAKKVKHRSLHLLIDRHVRSQIKDHQLNEHQFAVQTLCQYCSKPLWGIHYQGYLCGCK